MTLKLLSAAALALTIVTTTAVAAEPVCKAEVCNRPSNDNTEECYYPGTDVLQTYAIYRNASGRANGLAATLTSGRDQTSGQAGNTVSAEYKWQNKAWLTVTQYIDGGVVTVTFLADEHGTTVTTHYRWDK